MSKAAIHAMTMSLAPGMGPLRHPPQRDRAGRNPDRGHEQAALAREWSPARATARAAIRWVASAAWRNCRISAAFLMSDGCQWLNGETIVMDGAAALATGGNFYELRRWGDAEWKAAREAIQALNARDKAERG